MGGTPLQWAYRSSVYDAQTDALDCWPILSGNNTSLLCGDNVVSGVIVCVSGVVGVTEKYVLRRRHVISQDVDPTQSDSD